MLHTKKPNKQVQDSFNTLAVFWHNPKPFFFILQRKQTQQLQRGYDSTGRRLVLFYQQIRTKSKPIVTWL